mgnify:CR=1 FL=1
MEAFLSTVIEYTSWTLELAAAAVIMLGTVQALWIYVVKIVCTKCKLAHHARARLRLGHALSLSLELLIAADVLKTVQDPSWTELGQLGAIVLIRTVLNYFLILDMKKIREEEEETGTRPIRTGKRGVDGSE